MANILENTVKNYIHGMSRADKKSFLKSLVLSQCTDEELDDALETIAHEKADRSQQIPPAKAAISDFSLNLSNFGLE